MAKLKKDKAEEIKDEKLAKGQTEVDETLAKEGCGELPDYARKICKALSSYEELYIDAKGGSFTKNTPESIVGDAVLYKNPFYKQ